MFVLDLWVDRVKIIRLFMKKYFEYVAFNYFLESHIFIFNLKYKVLHQNIQILEIRSNSFSVKQS